MSEKVHEDILENQFQMELKIEKALRSDGVSDDSIVSNRHRIRGFIFYPNGKALTLPTYSKHLKEMVYPHRSLPYRRLMDAISNMELELDTKGIKKRRF